ncbi:MAG: hypothetical protein ACI4P5_06610, partial [Candidatus Fimadaptatus sp.]
MRLGGFGGVPAAVAYVLVALQVGLERMAALMAHDVGIFAGAVEVGKYAPLNLLEGNAAIRHILKVDTALLLYIDLEKRGYSPKS